jgi:hypothetical protein
MCTTVESLALLPSIPIVIRNLDALFSNIYKGTAPFFARLSTEM